MKRIILAIASLALYLPSGTAHSADLNVCKNPKVAACRVELNKDIKYCVTAFRGQKPRVRIANEIACAKTAWKDYIACVKSPTNNTCTTACQTSYNNGVAQCQLTHNPAVCNGEPNCETVVLNDQAFCIDQHMQQLNTCTANCPQ